MSPQIVYDQDGKAIKLDRKLGEGGEGSIYGIAGSSEYCPKSTNLERLSTESTHCEARENACDGAQPPDDPTWITQKHHSIAWPAAAYFRTPDSPGSAGFPCRCLIFQSFSNRKCFMNARIEKCVRLWCHVATPADSSL